MVIVPEPLKRFVCFDIAKCDLVHDVEMAFQIADSASSLILHEKISSCCKWLRQVI